MQGLLTNEHHIKALSERLDFMIENQEQLKVENKPMEFPEWNKGYLEALTDMRKELNKS